MGIVTERDIVRWIAKENCLTGVIISQVMTRQLTTLSLHQLQDIFELLTLLRSSRIRHLPIMNEQGGVLGVIKPESLRAILKPADMLQMRRVSQIMATQVIRLQHRRLLQFLKWHSRWQSIAKAVSLFVYHPSKMSYKLNLQPFNLQSTNVPTFNLQTFNPISKWQAHEMLHKHHIRRLVMVDEAENLAGIITQSTLLWVLDSVKMYTTVKLLQQNIKERIQALRQATERMQQEIKQRQQTEEALNQTKENLAEQVFQQTQELTQANLQLQQALRERIAVRVWIPIRE